MSRHASAWRLFVLPVALEYFFELALVFAYLDHVASVIVNAND
jgi:hypothetical protein